jgi:hypothetical protein
MYLHVSRVRFHLKVKYARGLIRPGMAVLSVYVFRRGTVDDARRHLLSLPPLSYLDVFLRVCVKEGYGG